MPSDAVVWEEVEARTSETTELGGNFLAFMVLACLIGSVGIFTGSPILIIGAMVVGPEFGPLAGLCVAIVERRRDVALRSLTALGVGFPIGITAAFLFTLICVATGLVDSDFKSVDNPLTQFIAKPDAFSVIVACFAGAAGHALADLGQVGGAGRGADLGDDDPRRRQHRRRRGARQLGRLARRDGAAQHQPDRDRPRRRRSPSASSAASTSGGGGAIAVTTRGSPPACRAPHGGRTQ